jgi:hypothetical protein
MSPKVYKSTPPLKVSEFDSSLGDKAYISFEEYIDVPGLEKADIRIEFDRNNSFAEISALVLQLKASGFTFVVQKNS